MAANFSNTYMFNAHIETVCAVLNDTRFHNALKFRFISRAPIQNGMKFCFASDVNFSSWGENIDIDVFYVNDNASQVVIKSECSMPTQIIDWGKNKSNVNKIYNQLISVLASAPVAPQMPMQPVAPVAPVAPEQPVTPPAPVAPQPPVVPVAPPAPTSPKFCSKCGASLTAGSNFCQVCGNKVI